MIVKTAPTHCVEIHMAGDISLAGQVIQRHAIDHGMCVTLSPQSFIYTGGREEGFRIGFINYPRFPAEHVDEIDNKAMALADVLMRELGQHSYCIVTPVCTAWHSRREVQE
ncbi:hypothetical protein V3589_02655 [Sinorhizobium fredii]|uniref:hypothetical protein n=1 Tax=Rhizobium fredii TaxID=380 RepID=UPI0030B00044